MQFKRQQNCRRVWDVSGTCLRFTIAPLFPNNPRSLVSHSITSAVFSQELLHAAKLGLRFEHVSGAKGGVVVTAATGATSTRKFGSAHNSWLATAPPDNVTERPDVDGRDVLTHDTRSAAEWGHSPASRTCTILEVDATHQLPSSQELRAYFEHGFPVVFRNLLSGLGCHLGACPAQASAVPAGLHVLCLR